MLEAHGKLSSVIMIFSESFDHPLDSLIMADDSFDYRQLSSTIMNRLTRAFRKYQN